MTRRTTLAALFGATLLGVPLVLLHGGNALEAGAEGNAVGAGTASVLPHSQLVRYKDLPPSVSMVTELAAAADAFAAVTTSAPPASVTTSVALAPRTTSVPAPTTTTAAPATTTTTMAPHPAPSAAGRSATGQATWYSTYPNGCASPVLAFGTVLTVTNVATGARIVCTVDDREEPQPGRIVDLSETGFSQLAPLSQGVVTVTITW